MRRFPLIAAGVFAGFAAAYAVVLATHATESPAPSQAARLSPLERGSYLVRTSGCYDCHTPFKMGPDGPAPD